MATAYVAQVVLDNGTHVFVGAGCALTVHPKFWRAAGLRRALNRNFGHYGASYYSKSKHAMKTQIIKIDGLERGLKDSSATILGFCDFVEKKKEKTLMRGNPRAFYKLATVDKTGKKNVVKTWKDGPFGHIFKTPSTIRRWTTDDLARFRYHSDVLKLHEYLNERVVIETVMDDDNINITQINYYPLKDFYLASPSVRRGPIAALLNKPIPVPTPPQATPITPPPAPIHTNGATPPRWAFTSP